MSVWSSAMLAITEQAAQAINALVSQREMPEGSGARIAPDAAGQRLELAVVSGPAPDDLVVEGPGAKVYLEQQAAQVLDDQLLDVEQHTQDGAQPQLQFAIVPQATPGMH